MKSWCLFASLIAWSSSAAAQSIDIVGSGVDLNTFRLEQSEQPPEERETLQLMRGFGPPEAPKEFTLKVVAPSGLLTNPLRMEDGSENSYHFVPSFILEWSRAGRRANIGVMALVYHDEITDYSDIDQTVYGAKFSVSTGDRKRVLQPSVYYFPKVIHAGVLPGGDVTFHDFGISLGTTVSLCKQGVDCGSSLAIDGGFMRREATLAELEINQPVLELALQFRLPRGLTGKFTQRVEGRFYTGGSREGRDDVNLKSGFTVVIPTGSPMLVLLGALLESNFSNAPGQDYFALDIGPTVGLVTQF